MGDFGVHVGGNDYPFLVHLKLRKGSVRSTWTENRDGMWSFLTTFWGRIARVGPQQSQISPHILIMSCLAPQFCPKAFATACLQYNTVKHIILYPIFCFWWPHFWRWTLVCLGDHQSTSPCYMCLSRLQSWPQLTAQRPTTQPLTFDSTPWVRLVRFSLRKMLTADLLMRLCKRQREREMGREREERSHCSVTPFASAWSFVHRPASKRWRVAGCYK